MQRRTLMSALFAVCLASPLFADEKAEKVDPNSESLCQAVQQIATGHASLAYGREHKVPEALLTAVDIFLRHPTEEFKPKVEGEGTGLQPLPDPAKELGEILKEAKQMRPDDAALAQLVARMEERLKDKSRAALRPRTFISNFSGSSLLFGDSFTAGPASVTAVGASGVAVGKRFRIVAKDNSGRVVASNVGLGGIVTLNFSLARAQNLSFTITQEPPAPMAMSGTMRITVR